MKKFTVFVFATALGSAFGVQAAGCVSDDPITPGGGGPRVDAGSTLPEAASACAIPTTLGVDCFGAGRCKNRFETCCVGLGNGTLTGVCVPNNADAAQVCASVHSALWECDRGKDCLSDMSRCCIDPLLKLVDRSVCPAVVDVGSGDPGKEGVARCVTTPNCGTAITACETSKECDANETCTPVSIQGKILGACLPK
jgi:hypothetical protein